MGPSPSPAEPLRMDFDPTNPATYRNPARTDPRSVDDLLAAALGLDSEDDAYWDAINALQWRGTPEVFDRAVALGGSFCRHERRTAAKITTGSGGQLDAGRAGPPGRGR